MVFRPIDVPGNDIFDDQAIMFQKTAEDTYDPDIVAKTFETWS